MCPPDVADSPLVGHCPLVEDHWFSAKTLIVCSCMSRTKPSGKVSALAVRDKQLGWNLPVDNVCTHGPAQTHRRRP